MTIQGFMDCKGNPIIKDKHGGNKAAYFIYFMVVMSNVANVANLMNLVTYLHGTMHMGVASSSNTVTNFVGGMSGFALLGAFLSDSYITRFKTILIFGPFEFLGFGLLALQAHLPSLHPPGCDINGDWSNCERVHGFNAVLLYIAIYTIALGEGCLRAALPSFGGDQFDSNDPVESQQKSSFFNWFTFGISLGAFASVLLIVWIENYKGWDIGFAVCAFAILLGVAVMGSGFSFYRNQKPSGSALTRMLQVFVVAFKKRKLVLPKITEDLKQESVKEDGFDMEILSHTKGFKFLDKAAIFDSDGRSWSLCTVTQVEETKIILRMIPIIISSILGYMPSVLLLTFTVQQGNTMNTKLGKIHISPANLFVIPVIFQMVMLVIYDRLFVPFARRITGYASGITHLQRVGVGFLSISLALCAAALVEMKRMNLVKDNGLQDSGTGVPMSVFWLGIQFFIVGITDVTAFVGLLEFFSSEASKGMKSIGTAIFWCVLGLSSLLGTFVVEIVNKATRHGGDARGWLEASTLNESHLDRFYWLLCGISFLAFLNFLFWARSYLYRHDPRITSS